MNSPAKELAQACDEMAILIISGEFDPHDFNPMTPEGLSHLMQSKHAPALERFGNALLRYHGIDPSGCRHD